MKIQKIVARNLEYFYDEVEDLLYIHLKKNNYQSSKEMHGIVFDLNKENELIGLEILKATELFGINKNFLKSMSLATLEVNIDSKGVMLKFFIKADVNNKKKQKTTTESFSNLSDLHSQKVEFELLPLARIAI